MLELTNTHFDITIASTKPVLVDFWAEWCGPCRRMHAIIEEVEKELGEKILFCKLNIDHFPEIAGRYDIMSIPTFILFSDGKIKDRQSGSMDASSLTEWLGSHS